MPKYSWSGDSPPEIEKHSLCKHAILKDYLVKYILVCFSATLAYPGRPWRLTIVDGFAGGGLYEYRGQEKPGSPLVILQAVKEAKAMLVTQHGRDKVNFDVDIICIEKDAEAAAHLQSVLNQPEYAQGEMGAKTRVWPGEFGDHLPHAKQFIKDKSKTKPGKCLFILDQYGYSDVLFPQLREILSMNSEVILTFAVSALATFKKYDGLQKIVSDQEAIEALERMKDRPGHRRVDIQRELSDLIWQQSRAPFYTPFFIQLDKSSWGYLLVHLSQHFKARDVMIDVHWKHDNDLAHYGGPGLNMFGYKSSNDLGELIGAEFRFNEVAKERTMKALPEDILRFLRENLGPVSFQDLKMGVSNETPASDDMIRTVLMLLRGDGELLLRREKKERIRASDELQLSPQALIPFTKKR